MKPDKRNKWQYRDCAIVPFKAASTLDCKDFGDGVLRTRYWFVAFPDTTWIYCATKRDCRAYIDKPQNNIHRVCIA